jgi:hypothetical protein
MGTLVVLGLLFGFFNGYAQETVPIAPVKVTDSTYEKLQMFPDEHLGKRFRVQKISMGAIGRVSVGTQTIFVPKLRSAPDGDVYQADGFVNLTQPTLFFDSALARDLNDYKEKELAGVRSKSDYYFRVNLIFELRQATLANGNKLYVGLIHCVQILTLPKNKIGDVFGDCSFLLPEEKK